MPSEPMAIEVTTEADPTPLVRVVANQLRQKLRSKDLAAGFTASATLKSCRDQRAVNLRFGNSIIHVSQQRAPADQLTYVLDFDDDNAATKIEGAWRNPIKAYQVTKLLTAPGPNWADSAKRFWSEAAAQPELPECLVVNCLDEDRELTFGSGSHKIELHGNSTNLNKAFMGEDLIALMVVSNRLQFRGSMQDLAYLSQVGQKIMLGHANG